MIDDRRLKLLASIGPFVGGVFGMAGTFALSASLRGLAWGIHSVALVMAAAILTYVRLDSAADFLGFSSHASLVSTTLLRLPVLRRDFLRLDLDSIED